MALEYRYSFGTDVVIDMIGYLPPWPQRGRRSHREHSPCSTRRLRNIAPVGIYDRGPETRPRLRPRFATSKPSRGRDRSAPVTHQEPTMRDLPTLLGLITTAVATSPEIRAETGLSGRRVDRTHLQADDLPAGFHIPSQSEKTYIISRPRWAQQARRRLGNGGSASPFASLVRLNSHSAMSARLHARAPSYQRHSS